jgi:hypothetical protein
MRKYYLPLLIIIGAIVLLAVYTPDLGPAETDYSFYKNDTSLNKPSKITACQVRGPLPDPDCTPGAVFENATVAQICVSGYSRSVRNVSVATKKKIYEAYGFKYPQPTGDYEMDHLIPLAIGGNNEAANLFPESAEPRPGYREKDLVENYLRNEVCAGRIDLKIAQKAVATNWVKIYEGLSLFDIWKLEAQVRSYND